MLGTINVDQNGIQQLSALGQPRRQNGPLVRAHQQRQGVQFPATVATLIAVDVVSHPVLVDQPAGLRPTAAQLLRAKGIDEVGKLLPLSAQRAVGAEHFVVHAAGRSIAMK